MDTNGMRSREERPLDMKVMELSAHVRMGLNGKALTPEKEQVYSNLLFALHEYAQFEKLYSDRYIIEMVKSYKQSRAEIPGQTALFPEVAQNANK